MPKEFKANVIYLEPDKLIPYHQNTKKHPKSQLDLLASILLTHGFDQPIVVDKDYVIAKGHGRREAAIIAGIKKVPVIIRDDLSPADIRALRISDNKLAEAAEWDLDALAIEMSWLQEEGTDLGLTGFSTEEVDSLMQATVPESLDDLEEQYGEHDDSHFWDKINIKLPPEVMQVYEDLMKRAGGDKPHEKFEAILGAVDISALEEMKNIEQDDDAA